VEQVDLLDLQVLLEQVGLQVHLVQRALVVHQVKMVYLEDLYTTLTNH
jgi:hypothetical protein